MRAKIWVKRFFLYVLLVCGIVGLVNFTVDPNGVFGSVCVKGLNANKTRHSDDRVSRFYYLLRSSPDTLLIGTSRIGTMHPDEAAKYTHDKVYNMSLSGATIYEQSLYFKYIVEHKNIKRAVIAVDFFAFLPSKLFNDPLLQKRVSEPFFMQDYIDSLFSVKTLVNSYKTIIENIKDKPYENDFNIGWRTYYPDAQKLKEQGDAMLQERSQKTLKDYAKDNFSNPSFKDDNATDDYMRYFRQMVQLAKSKNIELIVYVSPIYYTHFDLIYAKGLGNTFETWKKNIAKETPLYDFTGHNSVTMDTKRWWDTSHINKEGADMVLARLFDAQPNPPPADFGVKLNAQNINEHLKRLRLDVTQERIQAVWELLK